MREHDVGSYYCSWFFLNEHEETPIGLTREF